MSIMKCAGTALVLTMLAQAGNAAAQEVVRHPIPDSDFPIARAVEIPQGMTTVYVSGAVPTAPEGSGQASGEPDFGDTAAQTVSVLQSIEKTLKDLKLGMGDVVKMTVFLVGPEGQPMDFEGFMKGYTQFFGTKEQPNLPARSVIQVAGLANPAWLVEIEVIAARPGSR